MSEVGQKEILTQKHVIQLFKNELDYDYLGHWQDREGNSNIEEGPLADWLRRRKYSDKVINKVLYHLGNAKTVSGSKTLCDANREVYGMLRYGVKVRPDVGEQNVTVWLIDWENPAKNDFAITEDVTVAGVHDKRPDIVLYVNGIALGVLELKRSTVSVTEGIRQNLDNQKKDFIRPFFATVQLVMAGNDTEGLRYGVIETQEKYWLNWKENSPVSQPLDRALQQLCRKERLLEIVHDFEVFDAGTKKICRHNQYFGVRAAQEHIKQREGGIIWHTQGSGKSLTMIWLAKWIREHVQDSRVLIITDRTELDEQIEKFFLGVDENIYRTKSGADLVSVLNLNEEWLVCSLIHKFGTSEEGDIDAYLKDIESHLPKGFHAKGDIFVFVDECHRTQSGKLHEAMKAILPGVMLIGFTGTPLLKKDKKKSIEVFGPYIHTYKYDEAVRDKVVLDLRYEARDIDQNITSQEKIDQWFEIKTKGLSDLAKAQLKQRWGTLQKVLSSQDRLEKIVADMLLDMETRDRLQSGHGNAMLVSDSVYSACRFFEMFQKTDLKGKCAIVTSYRPSSGDIKGEETGEGLTEKLRKYEIYRKMLADYFDEPEEKAQERLEELREAVKALCEPVQPPRDSAAYLKFFCTSDTSDAGALKDNEPKRVALYKLTSSLVRAYANLTNEMQEAGYSVAETQEIKAEVQHYEKVREEVKLASGDYVDMKVFEPAMRHLLDTCIRAEESEKVSAFDDMSLVELIVERGEAACDELPKGLKENSEAMAETIENNVRKVIIDEMAVNPKYYEKMSELLDELIKARKNQALNYKAYLAKVVELTKKVKKPEMQSSYPASINRPALRALYDNLKDHAASTVHEAPVPFDRGIADDETSRLAVDVDRAIRNVKKADWRGKKFKEKEVRNAIKSVLGGDEQLVDSIFEIVKSQRDY